MAPSSYKGYVIAPDGVKGGGMQRRMHTDKVMGRKWYRFTYGAGFISWAPNGSTNRSTHISLHPDFPNQYFLGVRAMDMPDIALEVLAGPFPTLKAAKAAYVIGDYP